MTEIDWIILALLAGSTLVGVWRGVVREILAIAGWVVGIILAMNFSADIAEAMPLESIGYLPRVMISAVLVVVFTLFAAGLLGKILRRLMEAAEITFEDRALGAVFGFVRGIVVVCAAVFLFGMPESIHSSRMWRQSSLIGPAETLIDWSLPYLPDWIAGLRRSERGPASIL